MPDIWPECVEKAKQMMLAVRQETGKEFTAADIRALAEFWRALRVIGAVTVTVREDGA